MNQMQFRSEGLNKAIRILAFVPLLTGSLLAFVPFRPGMPKSGLDSSWAWGMSYAVDHGIAIGSGIVFTFGPLANLYTQLYSPVYGDYYLALGIYLALGMFVGTWSLFVGKGQIAASLIFGVVIVWFGWWRDALFAILPVLAIFNLIGAELPGETLSGRRLKTTLFLLPTFGILPLVKLSFAPICIIGMCFAVVILILHHAYKSALASSFVPLLTFLALWIGMDQPLSNLPTYLLNAGPIISGYTEAMGVEGTITIPLVLALGAILLLYGLFAFRKLSKYNSIAAVLLSGLYLFLMFKSGLIRQDGHAAIAGLALSLVTVSVWPFMQPSWPSVLLNVVSGTIGICIAFIALSVNPIETTQRFGSNAVRAVNGTIIRILQPEEFESDFAEARGAIAKSDPVPSLSGDTDIYSVGQAALFASDNTWSPRPVFQSYSAYTPELLMSNARHLNEANAPQNILFNIEPIDKRLPALEDGASWPILFGQYSPTEVAGKRIVLKRNNSPGPQLIELGHVQAWLRQPITLPEHDGQIYAIIKVRPSLWGRLRFLLYKPSHLFAAMNLKSGQTVEYRVISGMMQTPFLISPLVQSSTDFLSLYADPNLLEKKKLDSLIIRSAEPYDLGWKNALEVTFYSYENPLDENAKKLLNFSEPAKTVIPTEGQCVGYFDTANDLPVVGDAVLAQNNLKLQGWVAPSIGADMNGVRKVIFLRGDQTDFVVPTTDVRRPDVVSHFNAPQMELAGYSTTLDLQQLHGHYKINLGVENNGQLIKCAQPSIDLTIN